ncbi:MAG: ATPase AAA [Pirellulaceae bacterium]|nr:MAG: ATPase AAA [Pirellulaceae bacterium]
MHWNTFNEYVEQQSRWLEMEGEAERERLAAKRAMERAGSAEESGMAILGLSIADYRTGLAGRILVDLVKRHGGPLPPGRIKVGTPVVLVDEQLAGDAGIAGVVSRRQSHEIQVVVEQWPDGRHFRLDVSPDETTRRRQLTALQMARQLEGRRGRLRDTLMGWREPRFEEVSPLEFRLQLNASQREAVQFAMAARDVAILHGPPGTGKTTTLAELIYQTVLTGGRVLACAPSNTAVDNLLERIVDLVPDVLRVGHPARVFPSLRGHTLDEQVEADPNSKIVRDMWREIDQLMHAASKVRRGRDANHRRGELYAEAGRLRRQARALERSTVRSIIRSASVICTTTTIDDELLGNEQFDLAVIDEAGQCVEPAIWAAVARADRIVFAGDHCQLPPTVVSVEAAREGFARSMMERLLEQFGETIYRRLKVQYRMHEQIMGFSNRRFYDDALEAHPSVRHHRLHQLEAVTVDESEPVVEFWDTAGAGWYEEVEPDGLSKRNVREAEWVAAEARRLMEHGVQPPQIAVIAPYAAQARILREMLPVAGLEIDTVDGFQGREKEAVLLSLVRSNEVAQVGFLADTRRINVALTRARRFLRVIGDSATLAHHPFYHDLIDYFDSLGVVRSVWELGTVHG